MIPIGIVRCPDKLGRLVLPKEVRENLNLLPGTPMEFFVEDEKVIIRRYQPHVCVCCGDVGNVKSVMLCPDLHSKRKIILPSGGFGE